MCVIYSYSLSTQTFPSTNVGDVSVQVGSLAHLYLELLPKLDVLGTTGFVLFFFKKHTENHNQSHLCVYFKSN